MELQIRLDSQESKERQQITTRMMQFMYFPTPTQTSTILPESNLSFDDSSKNYTLMMQQMYKPKEKSLLDRLKTFFGFNKL